MLFQYFEYYVAYKRLDVSENYPDDRISKDEFVAGVPLLKEWVDSFGDVDKEFEMANTSLFSTFPTHLKISSFIGF